MNILERLFSIGSIRKAIWRLWYPFLTRRLQERDVTFLNYAFEEDPPIRISIDPEDEADRVCIQLYHHVASQIDLTGKSVLEISCGHGGGASWISRTMNPATYTGLDLNSEGIRFCREHHQLEDLNFVQGDAQDLPFPENTFDVAINIEASHCYPDFRAFLAEVVRVVHPGGHFLYADFRFPHEIEDWKRAIDEAPMKGLHSRDISAEVLRGMNANADRRLSLVHEYLPSFLRSLGRDFAGVPESYVYEALKSGELEYRSWCLQVT
jgi:ubiquinone/menaquinone biosynthesis C-methylase UbiE